ncbi:hypothetical protein JMJ77_0002284 [Colletotrichum scovillei]|uniref:Uncharacterized protein n=1 Tax=Colletotrichum scovillei TaxID=1209932 RepID=A0A9P7R9A7_9PEZI|nr:hypothetical protein JMJ77_0002284 [Colletotrichum scovillei]KAG7070704.1 hypothetical protein JMJ76_0001950 [Colletotrichum scovillei]KAG7078944.1 hypothetical protein JMJ78_0002607 [Colletotrichum scovillei]
MATTQLKQQLYGYGYLHKLRGPPSMHRLLWRAPAHNAEKRLARELSKGWLNDSRETLLPLIDARQSDKPQQVHLLARGVVGVSRNFERGKMVFVLDLAQHLSHSAAATHACHDPSLFGAL